MQAAKFCRATLLSNQPCNRGPASAAIRDLLHQAPDMPPDVIANLTACATALEGSSATHRESTEAAAVRHSEAVDEEPVLLPQPIAQHTIPKPKRKHESGDEVSTAQLPRRKLNTQPSEAPAAADAGNGAQSLPSESNKAKKKKRSRAGEDAEAAAEAPETSRHKLDSQSAAEVRVTDGPSGDQNIDSSGSTKKKKKRRRDSEATAAASAAQTKSPAAPESQYLLRDGGKSEQPEEREPPRKKKKRYEATDPTFANDATQVAQPAVTKSSKRKSITTFDTSTAAETDTQPKKKKKKTKS